MSDCIIRRSLTDQVYSLIIKKIQTGELKPGERLNIEELAKAFGVSRTPLREAISRLIQNGFLESKHNVGPSVASFDKKKVVELIETNSILLEGVMRVIFREKNEGKLIAKLAEVLKNQNDAYEQGAEQDFFKNSVLFHETLIKACPNRHLAQLTEQTQIQIDVWVLCYQESDEIRQVSLKEHGELLDLLKEDAAEDFIAKLKIHNENALKYFMNKK